LPHVHWCLVSDPVLGRKYDIWLGLAARLGGIQQSEDQVHYQEQSCTSPTFLQQSLGQCTDVHTAHPDANRKEGSNGNFIWRMNLARGIVDRPDLDPPPIINVVCKDVEVADEDESDFLPDEET